MRSCFIDHKGKQLFLADYAHLSLQEFEREIQEVTEFLCSLPEHSTLVVNETTGLIGSPHVIDLFKKSVSKTKPYVLKASVAGVDVSGPRKILVDTVLRFTGQNAAVFRELEAAKDWLVET
jgi:hypothetical protein